MNRTFKKFLNDSQHQAEKIRGRNQLCRHMWVVIFCVCYLLILDLFSNVNGSCGAPNVSGATHGTIASARKRSNPGDMESVC